MVASYSHGLIYTFSLYLHFYSQHWLLLLLLLLFLFLFLLLLFLLLFLFLLLLSQNCLFKVSRDFDISLQVAVSLLIILSNIKHSHVSVVLLGTQPIATH